MLQLNCPHCGVRDETDLSCHGEAHIQRPETPHECTDEQWADYLFMRSNPRGLHLERWFCNGCRCWFNACRDTATHEIVACYPMGASVPAIVDARLRERGAAVAADDNPNAGSKTGA
ncbi:MAG: sarcosine oxidase subunit delta [Gammaproteobacteria bacterium]